jgi:hypothetical protein
MRFPERVNLALKILDSGILPIQFGAQVLRIEGLEPRERSIYGVDHIRDGDVVKGRGLHHFVPYVRRVLYTRVARFLVNGHENVGADPNYCQLFRPCLLGGTG